MLIRISNTHANYCYVTDCPANYSANYLFPVGFVNLSQTAENNHAQQSRSFVQQPPAPKDALFKYMDHQRQAWCKQNNLPFVPREVLINGNKAVREWLGTHKVGKVSTHKALQKHVMTDLLLTIPPSSALILSPTITRRSLRSFVVRSRPNLNNSSILSIFTHTSLTTPLSSTFLSPPPP